MKPLATAPQQVESRGISVETHSRTTRFLKHLLETADNYFWDEIKSFDFLPFPSKSTNHLLNNRKLPKIRELVIQLNDNQRFGAARFPVITVRPSTPLVESDCQSVSSKLIMNVLKIFSRLGSLGFFSYQHEFPRFNVAKLCDNLRKIKLHCKSVIDAEKFVHELIQLPLLESITIGEQSGEQCQKLGRHASFKCVMYSGIMSKSTILHKYFA